MKQLQSVCSYLTVTLLSTLLTKVRVQIAVATMSGNSLRQTVHTYRASVHQAATLVAVLLRVARVTEGLAEVMAAYRRVYDSLSPAG